ncbi:hypothetical protein VPH35_129712 [Triticum aestivum]
MEKFDDVFFAFMTHLPHGILDRFSRVMVICKREARCTWPPACAGSGEGSDRFGSIVRSLFLRICKRLFLGLEPVPSWSQGNNFLEGYGHLYQTKNRFTNLEM